MNGDGQNQDGAGNNAQPEAGAAALNMQEVVQAAAMAAAAAMQPIMAGIQPLLHRIAHPPPPAHRNDSGMPRVKELTGITSTEWKAHRRHFQSIIQCKNWNWATQKSVLKSSLGTQADIIVSDINPRINDENFTINNLLDVYEERFSSRRGTQAALVELDMAGQKIEEPIKAWYGRILELHARAHPEISDADRLVHWPLIQIFLSSLTSQIT